MRYIKPYISENYSDNILPSKPKFYERISHEEKEDLLGEGWINELRVDDKWDRKLKELGYITTHIPSGEPIPEKGKKWNKQFRTQYKSLFIYYDGGEFSPQIGPGNLIRIYEIDDEWFILEIDDRYNTGGYFHYYKCDQFEGLLQCLRDNEITPDYIRFHIRY